MLFDAIVDARAGLSNLRTKPRLRAGAVGQLEGMRLLVVEDNLINQQVARELLSAEGAMVEIADNGQTGVNAVAQAQVPFSAILMDIQMPVMDGYAATRVIRQDLGQTALPIIAMTANAMASDREACLRAGMNDHVGKPFDLPNLVEVLLQHTRRSHSGPTAPALCPPAADLPEAMPPQSAPLPPEMPAVDRMDTEEAIARLGGNVALYADVLESYLNELPGQPDQLDTLLANGNLAEAGRLLHTFKGLSATVGATYLAAVTKAAELAVKADAPTRELGPLRDAFRHTVERTAQLLKPLVHTAGLEASKVRTAPTQALSAQDRKIVRVALHELHTLLLASDLRALEVHSGLQIKKDVVALNGFDALSLSIAAFDFVSGVKHCEQVMQGLGA
jgi:CheY-like chemotaxis protein/HPt (histidine-containing phosphotransfer) domain-containing protein